MLLKLNGVGDLKRISASDMETQSLEFALLGFRYSFDLIFSHYAPLHTFWDGNTSFAIICWKYVIYYWILILHGIKRLHESEKIL